MTYGEILQSAEDHIITAEHLMNTSIDSMVILMHLGMSEALSTLAMARKQLGP